MWEHALGIRLCQCFPLGVFHLPLCLVLCFGYAVRNRSTVPDITANDTHITYISVHVMVHSVTLARTDILPEDGHTVTETCRRFYEILAF